MANVITLNEICKSFKVVDGFSVRKIHVLKDMSLNVPEKTVFGFLGRNGAGKSTTIKIILGLIKPDCGKISVFGKNPRKAASRITIGFLPEAVSLIDELTAEETLFYAGRLRGINRDELTSRIPSLLERVGLKHRKTARVRGFSKGMRQRLGLAAALVAEPNILIADEPQSGLDPEGAMMIKEALLSLKAEGKTVFYSTHQLLTAGQICDRIAILDRGKIVHQQEVGEDSRRLEEVFKSAITSEEAVHE